MPKSKKHPSEMTTDELLDHVFPPKVADVLRDAVAEKDEENSTDDDSSD